MKIGKINFRIDRTKWCSDTIKAIWGLVWPNLISTTETRSQWDDRLRLCRHKIYTLLCTYSISTIWYMIFCIMYDAPHRTAPTHFGFNSHSQCVGSSLPPLSMSLSFACFVHVLFFFSFSSFQWQSNYNLEIQERESDKRLPLKQNHIVVYVVIFIFIFRKSVFICIMVCILISLQQGDTNRKLYLLLLLLLLFKCYWLIPRTIHSKIQPNHSYWQLWMNQSMNAKEHVK